MFKPVRALNGRRQRGSPSGLNVCWRRAQHSPAGSQTLEFNDRSPSRHDAGDRTVPRRRSREPEARREPLYENYDALTMQAVSLRAAAGRIYGHLGVIGSGVGRIERHLSSSCGSIDHFRAACEVEDCAGRRTQWVLLQRWLPREIPYERVCCPHHRRFHPHYDTPDPIRRPVAPRPSCSFHNLPESYRPERAGRKVSPRESEGEERSEAEGEEERADWSLLIPEEEGSLFDDGDYTSDSDNSQVRSPEESQAGPSHEPTPGPSSAP